MRRRNYITCFANSENLFSFRVKLQLQSFARQDRVPACSAKMAQ